MTETKLAPNMPQWMKDHVDLYVSSGGTDGHMYTISRPGVPDMTVPSLLLITTGRKSGQSYLFPLFYRSAENSYFIIASKGGAPEHPGWYQNILSDPQVSIQVGTEKMQAHARTAQGEEREQLWKQAVEFFPPYAEYQLKSGGREIPVVVLDPIC